MQIILDRMDDALTNKQKRQVKAFLHEYQDVFANPGGKLGCTDLMEHTIDTGDAKPIKQRPRRVPLSQREIESQEVDKMLEEGVIEPSDSPWASPVVLVTKKDGSIRFCCDFRKINALTRKDAYPLPRIDDSLDALSGSRWFCTLDLKSGYWQCKMAENDKPKTAFTTGRGLFQWKVMPFGLVNAGATFERLMERVLSGLHWKKCLVYLDDVIVFGTTFENTLQNLTVVLQRFREANLKLKAKKCTFFKKSVQYLGHIVSEEGISCDPEKIKAVKEWTDPRNKNEVQSFLGLASYYRKFIHNFSSIAAPLYDLTKKNAKFAWTERCSEAFQKLKSSLTSAAVLAYPSDDGRYILDTDASLFGIGAVLSQEQNGEERVIAYASKSLSKTQRRYCTTYRELLAVVKFVKHFHHYLWGRKFLIRTDHASLVWLKNFQATEGMISRWTSILDTYDYELQHRRGSSHGNADGLSRIPPKRRCKRVDCPDCNKMGGSCMPDDNENKVQSIQVTCTVVENTEKVCQSVEENITLGGDTAKVNPKDSEICTTEGATNIGHELKLELSPLGGATEKVTQLHKANQEHNENFYKRSPMDSDLSCKSAHSLLDNSIGGHTTVGLASSNPDIVFSSVTSDGSVRTVSSSNVTAGENTTSLPDDSWLNKWSTDECQKWQAEDKAICTVINWILSDSGKPSWDEIAGEGVELKALWGQWKRLELHENVLYRRPIPQEDPSCVAQLQLVVPEALRKEIMHSLHNIRSAGHLGVPRVYNHVKSRFYWPFLKDDVTRWCRQCNKCARRKPGPGIGKAPLQHKPVGLPLQRIAIDIMGPLPITNEGNEYIMVVGDYFTKWTEAYAIPDHTAQTVADKLVTEFICRFGVPFQLHTDQGREFESKLLAAICKLLEIDKTRTTPYRPQSDGMIERFNRTLQQMLAMYVNENKRDWDDHLPYVMFAYRSSIHASTGFSPNSLMLGREVNLPLDILVGPVPDEDMCPDEYVEWVKEALQLAFEKARQNLNQSSMKQKILYDRKGKFHQFPIGSWVWRWYPPEGNQKFGLGWVGPFLVTRKFSDITYEIQESENSQAKVVHVDHLKVYEAENMPPSWITADEGGDGNLSDSSLSSNSDLDTDCTQYQVPVPVPAPRRKNLQKSPVPAPRRSKRQTRAPDWFIPQP